MTATIYDVAVYRRLFRRWRSTRRLPPTLEFVIFDGVSVDPGPRGMEGHHLATPSEIAFVVRIPSDVLGDLILEDLDIQLYRIDEPRVQEVGPEPLAEQFRSGVTLLSGSRKPRPLLRR